MIIEGKSIFLRRFDTSDAEFIVRIRTGELGKFLNPVAPDIEAQRNWIRSRMEIKSEYYFIITDKEKRSIGTIRLYNAVNDMFTWGTWVIIPQARGAATLESALLLYDLAFLKLAYKVSTFEVRKDNLGVINFHRKFGAKQISADNDNVYFEFSGQDYVSVRERHYFRLENLLKAL